MITINYYTGNYQSACRPQVPRVGSYVRIHETADAREYDDFHNMLKREGLEAEDFVRWHPKIEMNVYRITKARKY
jgi:hypothetical protein